MGATTSHTTRRTRLSHRLRAAIRRSPCPQWQLAQAIGVHPSRLSQWVRGYVVAHQDPRVVALGGKLGITPPDCFLLTANDDPDAPRAPSLVPDLRRYRRGPFFDDRPGGPYVELDARIWDDPGFRSLAPVDQGVTIWLLTGPPALSSTVSVLRLADDLRLSLTDAQAALGRILEAFDWAGLVILDADRRDA